MSEATIRTAIYNVVNGVSNVGKVYDYQRFNKELDVFFDLFKTTIAGVDQIRGWMIGYNGMDEPYELGTGAVIRPQKFTVYGVIRLNDELVSEKAAAALAEAICDALDADATLHAYSNDAPAGIREFAYLPFGSVFCHWIEIGLTVTEQATIA